MADITGHTPEPWVVYHDDDGVEIRAGADGGDVMGMFIHGEEMDANARLIASAPALLSALEDIVTVFAECVPGDDCKCYEDGQRIAEDAIAKAKGGDTANIRI